MLCSRHHKESQVHVLADVLQFRSITHSWSLLAAKTPQTHSNLHACQKAPSGRISLIATMMLSVVERVHFSYNTRSHIVHLPCCGSS